MATQYPYCTEDWDEYATMRLTEHLSIEEILNSELSQTFILVTLTFLVMFMAKIAMVAELNWISLGIS